MTGQPDTGITIRHQLMPGDMGAIIQLHGQLYARECDFNRAFEAYVAIPLAKFVMNHGDREQIWIVEQGGVIRGSMAIVKHSKHVAQLRWLLLHPDLRGRRLGKRLVNEGIAFSREHGYWKLILWTADVLLEATELYKSVGFRLVRTRRHRIWGIELAEQKYKLSLKRQ
jgi:GNAT superfamily N-acetyltransferase